MRVGPFAFRYQGNGATPCQCIDTTRKAIDCATTLPWEFLYNETLEQTFRHVLSKFSTRRQIYVLYPHFEKVKGGVEPWLMARWKAHVEFLLNVIELLFLSFTVEALQGKMCQTQNSLPSGGGRSLGAKISGEGFVSGDYCFGFYKTRHILLSDSANCTVLCAVVLTLYRRVTDRRTELP